MYKVHADREVNLMKALVYVDVGKVEIRDVEKPRIGSGEVLIKTKFATLCGTDESILEGKFPAKTGVILGHEASGIVEEVGGGVPNMKPRDPVICAPYLVCGRCIPCRAGRYNVCADRKHLGIEVDGLFAEYFKLPGYAVYPAPPGMDLEEGALVEPASVAYHAVRRVSPTPSDSVVIIGAGRIGLLALQSVAAFGCQRIIVSESIDKRLQLAGKLGAHRVVNPQNEDLEEIVKEETDGTGVDIVIEAAGFPETIAETVGLVRSAGKICLIGIPEKSVEFDFLTLVRREIDIVTSDASLVGYEKTHELVAKRIIDVRPLITHTFRFEDIAQAFDVVKGQEAIKVLIEFPD
jgi:2-desacetyl-2-hydroxyethyl bacteriochlorophyllide A dehydrogenase